MRRYNFYVTFASSTYSTNLAICLMIIKAKVCGRQNKCTLKYTGTHTHVYYECIHTLW